ncbi:hypothetical protein CCY99_00845 [Helicobacter sp. 16-1353]|uniref:DUF262 domain-containing protein n=1 Tax=Helicobacter sp. 16-1353 TaxID=2004996 RepID=UPI000DCCDBF1|nr:DUF262 domain-containing protein [Helicobacter sp. 16-1353]RAX55279.1 hypothetical protein CCY99_00845 [Helicobacter sp. 16-1353]
MSDGTIKVEIKKVNEVLKKSNLKIPPYQRPYRWDERNVYQLLDDIHTSWKEEKNSYRIGSVILHNNHNNNEDKYSLDIVDGQQRLTTIILLNKAILDSSNLPDLKYNHIDSHKHIKANFKFIKEWLENNIAKNEMEKYWDYINNDCEFVEIIVDDLNQAFQMFDSQNGRGKELEAYNLLKAYHIRAMEECSQDERILCDRSWEKAIKNESGINILKQLFNEQLYRSRKWSKRLEAGKFSKKNIDEFKGFNIDRNHPIQFPFQNPYLLQYLTTKIYDNTLKEIISTQSRFKNGDGEIISPFVNINQPIINGKQFFDYIATYVEIYKRMFGLDSYHHSYHLSEFKKFYSEYCLHYNGAKRKGDAYLKEVYKSLVFVLFDKFGEKGLNRYYKILYRLIYINRLIKKRVDYRTTIKLPIDYFSIIYQAKDLGDLVQLEKELTKKLQGENKLNEKIKDVKIYNFIKNGDING